VFRSIVPTTLALIAAALLIPASASAGALGACWKSEFYAAGTYGAGLGKCIDKAATKGGDFDACQSSRSGKFFDAWIEAVTILAKKGGDCNVADQPEIDDDIVDMILDADEYVRDNIAMGSPNKASNNLEGALGKAVGAYSRNLLKAEGNNAKKADAKALKKARKKALAKFEDSWNQFVKAAKKKGVDFGGASADVSGDVTSKVEDITEDLKVGTPPPPIGKIKSKDNGIQFKATHVLGDIIKVRWEATKKTNKKSNTDYCVELENAGSWVELVCSPDKQGKNLRVQVLDEYGFCLRMVTEDGSGNIVGSGTSGNAPPCKP
jgi:hypothetical protein